MTIAFIVLFALSCAFMHSVPFLAGFFAAFAFIAALSIDDDDNDKKPPRKPNPTLRKT